jgi:hypothetical protein
MAKSRRMGWARRVTRMGDRRGACMVLIGKFEGSSPLGRPRLRWELNVKMEGHELD